MHCQNLKNKYAHLLQFYDKTKLDNYINNDIDKLIELYDAVQPKHVAISSLMNNCENVLVNSPDGWIPVVDCVEKHKSSLFTFTFESGKTITASYDHLYQKSDQSWWYAKDLKINDRLISIGGHDTITNIVKFAEDTLVYDLSVDHENHRYYTNGISSHNTGKSVFLANFAVNYALEGKNVIYLTFELSEELVSMRLDSMLTGIPSKNIFKNIDDVEMKVRIVGKKSGSIQVKYMPSGKTTNDLRAYMKEFEVKTGKKVDILLVDYLDLLMPASRKVSAENLYIKDKYVSEELRNLAMEKHCILITASQLGRTSVEETVFDHSHISGGISKIQTADNVIGIYTSRAMRENGKYQLQLMKTRNSSGVGQSLELDFDIDTLRITDPGEDAQSFAEISMNRSSKLIQDLTRKSTQDVSEPIITDPEPMTVPKAQTESTKLRALIAEMQQDY